MTDMHLRFDNPVPVENERSRAPVRVFSRDDLGTSIPERFERIVRQHPDRLAVASSRHRWTYVELNRVANRLAHALLATAGAEPAPVGLLFEHDTPLIAALLAVLKARKFYASLDASFPRLHNEAVLDDLKAPVLLCDRANLGAAVEIAKGRCVVLVYETIDEQHSPENPGLSVTGDMPFGIFYTSGSTGEPKGVQRNHDLALHRLLMDTSEVSITRDDRQALLTSLTFAGSSSDVNRALLNGASLHLYDIRKFGTAYLAQWLRQEAITYLRPPIALFRHFLAALGEKENFPDLRVISVGGAALFRQDIEAARQHVCASCTIIHRYSNSEGGEIARLMIDTSMQLDTPIVPVGRPIEGKEVIIVDEHRRELPVTEAGEIAVRSRYLGAGYWARPEQTRKHYIPDPTDARSALLLTGDIGRIRPDGYLELLGRSDSLVKIRGFRVELAAVEAALRDLDSVAEAAVMALPDATGEASIVAYVVPSGSADAGGVRRDLAARLPEYMLPSAFVFLKSLPFTRSGKVDRKALPSAVPGHSILRRRSQAPRTSTEAALITLWSEILKVDRIGVDDNFFELGGHSLLAARVISRVNEQFEVNLLLRAVYDAPTVAALAASIQKSGRRLSGTGPSTNEAQAAAETRRLLGLS